MSADCEDEDDDALMLRICARDEAAFACLVRRHTGRFYGIAWRIVLDRSWAEDILQEAFEKLWAHPERFDPARGVQFRTWFSRVVVHLAIDDRRKGKTVVPMHEGLTTTLSAPGENAEATLIRSEQGARMDAAMKTIDLRQRTALSLVFTDGLSQKDAAHSMGIGIKALESLLSRGKAALRARLEKDGTLEKKRER